jgi:hypothetical protein
MPTITITFDVSERELAYLRMGKCDKPNGQRIKAMLLAQAHSNLRHEGEYLRKAMSVKSEPKCAAVAAPKGRAKPNHVDHSAQWLDDDNVDKLKQ